MSMSRHFKTVNYQEALQTTVRLDDCLPQDRLARFIADVVDDLYLSTFYARYGKRGAALMQISLRASRQREQEEWWHGV